MQGPAAAFVLVLMWMNSRSTPGSFVLAPQEGHGSLPVLAGNNLRIGQSVAVTVLPLSQVMSVLYNRDISAFFCLEDCNHDHESPGCLQNRTLICDTVETTRGLLIHPDASNTAPE